MYEHMKIIGLCGSASPKSSTKKLIEAALEAAKRNGADVEFINIAKLDIKGCIACKECKKDQVLFCSQNDDMTELYTKVNEADVILLGSPIYFGNISGQSKCFIDRTYAFFGSDGSKLKKGKNVAAIITHGHTVEGHYLDAATLLTQGFGSSGAKILSPEFFGGLRNADDITDAQLSRAQALGEKLTE
ncbi:MAG TPA: flavodoxin family protein [Methanocorpusculum sp.]|nr:flavodoxin family protein [Methanocorpusculum sp.]